MFDTRFRVLAGYALIVVAVGAQGVITTIAGTDFVFPSQPVQATIAPMGAVRGVATDSLGRVYVTDSDNSLIFKINHDGVLTVVAGNGIQGFSGDGGPATNASLFSPGGLTVGALGIIFFADTGNNRVRKVSPDGTISTVAGNGSYGFSGDGGPAVNATLNIPSAVAVDNAGNLLIVDAGNARIRKVAPDGVITTVAGNGTLGFSGDGGPAAKAMFNQPAAVAVDSKGNLFIADSENFRIRKVSSDGIISSVAGNGTFGSSGDGGPALNAAINQPFGVAVDSAGRLFIAETVGNRIREVTVDGTIVTIAGTGSAGFDGDGAAAVGASLNSPLAVTVDPDHNVLVADELNRRVRQIAPTGIITTMAGNGQFHFSGDGGPATSASLSSATGIALDGAGNLFFGDTSSNRVRQITPDGRIATVAGDGGCCFSGDGGPAGNAHINGPEGVALDKSGNLLIADSGNNRIRKVNSNGIITTVAGSGSNKVGGFSGDGGPATSAALRAPSGVAVDATGNLIIADQGNNRIRRVTSDGVIRTIAGDGRQLYAGDGGQASTASLYGPFAVAIDSQGNLYIAENNNRIRKVAPDGVITTVIDYSPPASGTIRSIPGATGIVVDSAGNLFLSDRVKLVVHRIPPNATGPDSTSIVAGNGVRGFSGDGGPATAASLQPSALAIDSAGALYIGDSGRIRKVLSSRPAIQATPNQLQFSAASKGAAPSAQQISLLGSVPGLAFSVQSTATWLRVSPEAGTTPRLLDVIADPGALQPGNYTASVSIATPDASPLLTTVSVTFTVGAVQDPKLDIDQRSLSFPFSKDANPRSQSLRLSNSGGGTLTFTSRVQTNNGGAWLSVSPASGQLSPSSPVTVSVTADARGLPPGTYTSAVIINDQSLPVTMTVSASNQAILLSQSGLSFLGVSQGGIVPPQNFGVINIGSGIFNWKASKSTLSGGNDWLQIGSTSGTTDSASPQIPTVAVSVNPSILPAGKYYGLIQVEAPGAANSPQALTVFLQVLPKGADIGVVTQPSEMLFTAPSDAGVPGSQQLLLYNVAAVPKSFRSSVTADPGLQVAVLPLDGTLDPQFATPVVVQPFTSGMAPGVYQGSITLQFSDGRIRSLHFSVVVPKGGGTQVSNKFRSLDQAACAPTKLLTALTTLGQAFTVSAGWPVALGVYVEDDCGKAFDSGSVTVGFSNGDAPIVLQPLNGGHWEATWPTHAGSLSQVILKVQASDPHRQLVGESSTSGTLQSDTDPPVFDKSTVVSAASGQEFQALAPGSIITIYGDRLADDTDQASGTPLPSQLGNSSVVIAGQIAPLFYASQNQLNAQIPFGVNPNTTQQILIQRGLTLSQPIAVDVAPAQPSTFSAGGGAIALDYRGTSPPFYVSPSSPATAGDTIVIFCAGLGVTDPPVKEGVVSPGSPQAQTSTVVQATLGAAAAPVQFAGLVPGFVGLYQVNLVVPSGSVTGDSVPLVVIVSGQSSAAAGLVIR
jgi:uncharacterized protein (TIGR03437 family)